MRTLLAFLFFLNIGVTSFSQVISYEDFKTIIPLIKKEDFKTAFTKTDQILNSTINDSSDMRGIVTYMNIYSAAGMVSLKQMTHDEFSKNANKYIGQRLVMSGHPCIDSTVNSFNSLQFFIEKRQWMGTTTTTNNANTNILFFEYFAYANAVDPDDYIGKNVRCGGTLESIEINPDRSTLWISRMYISNAFIRAADQK